MNSYNDTDATIVYRVRVLLIGIGERIDTRNVAPGDAYGLRLADLLPASQIDDDAWQDVNARVVMECDGGSTSCPMTIANWYAPIGPGIGPSLGVYDPVCRQ